MHPEDRLFATLDVTSHPGKLPSGMTVLFIDTVGFVSDLPPELVESFSATLEDIADSVGLLFSLYIESLINCRFSLLSVPLGQLNSSGCP